MFFEDLLRISLRQVLRQHRRNLGAVLAIALGTAGFLVIITMGRDVKINFNRDLDLLGGATRMKIYFEGPGDVGSRIKRPEWFRERTLRALRQIPGVAGVTATISKAYYGSSATTWKGQAHSFHIIGVDEHYWEVNSFTAKSGTLFGSPEVMEGRKNCVLGEDLAKKIFGHTNVVGNLLPIDRDLYRVVGVFGGVGAADRTTWAFIPLTTARSRLPNVDVVRILYLRCKTWDDVESVAAAIPDVVKGQQQAADLKVEVAWERLNVVKKTSWLIVLFIYVAIVATLCLGGFGIWNIMMNGVRARTREIGLKKAMGAQDRDILAQFMTEAICLSLGSALIGVALGRALIELVAYLLGNRPLEDIFWLCVFLGLLFASLIGMVAGLSPSVKASRMEVVSAVRYE